MYFKKYLVTSSTCGKNGQCAIEIEYDESPQLPSAVGNHTIHKQPIQHLLPDASPPPSYHDVVVSSGTPREHSVDARDQTLSSEATDSKTPVDNINDLLIDLKML